MYIITAQSAGAEEKYNLGEHKVPRFFGGRGKGSGLTLIINLRGP